MNTIFNKLLILGSVVVFFVSGVVEAAGTGGSRTVTKADTTSSGRLIITPGSNFANPDMCNASNVAVVLEDNPSLKTFQAVALTAFASGSNIKPFFAGCWDAPWGQSVPIILNMAVE